MCSGQKPVPTGKLLVIRLIPAPTLPVPGAYQNRALPVKADTFHMEMTAPFMGVNRETAPAQERGSSWLRLRGEIHKIFRIIERLDG